MSMPRPSNELSARVSHIEADIAALSESQRNTEAAISRLSDTIEASIKVTNNSIEATNNRIQQLSDAQTNAQKPRWDVIAAFLGVVVVLVPLMATVGGWYIRSQVTPMEKELGYLEREVSKLSDIRERTAILEYSKEAAKK